jgi:uncharacterized protein YjbJ (UPF0337 family)
MTEEGTAMGNRDRASNRWQSVRGWIKKTAGSTVGNKHLEHRGSVDRKTAHIKDAGEDVKDAAANVSSAVRNH